MNCEQEHRKLWRWLASHPEKSKEDYFKENNLECVISYCYACESANIGCIACPLPSPYFKTKGYPCADGLYDKWHRCGSDYSKRSKLAWQIAHLPWNGVECVEPPYEIIDGIYYEKDTEMENYLMINGKKTELIEEQLKRLGIVPKKESKWWRAEYREVYYFIDDVGNVCRSADCRIGADNHRYNIHNYFKTKEEAERYRKVLETEMLLQKYAEEHNGPMVWDNKCQHHRVFVEATTGKMFYGTTWDNKLPRIIYFSSEQLPRDAVKEIGEDGVKGYLTYEW